MNKLVMMIGATVGGSLGWYAGMYYDNYTAAFIFSSIGSIVGILGVWYLARRFMD